MKCVYVYVSLQSCLNAGQTLLSRISTSHYLSLSAAIQSLETASRLPHHLRFGLVCRQRLSCSTYWLAIHAHYSLYIWQIRPPQPKFCLTFFCLLKKLLLQSCIIDINNGLFPVPDPHASNRNRYAAVRGDIAFDAAVLEVQDIWLDTGGHAGCGLSRFTVSCCILARNQYVRVFWNLVSKYYLPKLVMAKHLDRYPVSV